jgi:hypothetical protein
MINTLCDDEPNATRKQFPSSWAKGTRGRAARATRILEKLRTGERERERCGGGGGGGGRDEATRIFDKRTGGRRGRVFLVGGRVNDDKKKKREGRVDQLHSR